MNDCRHIAGGEIHLAIKALPGASKTELAGIKDGRLRIRIAAAPEDGRANAALIAFLAGLLSCPKRGITVKKGEKSRLKTIALPLAYRVQLDKILEVEPIAKLG